MVLYMVGPCASRFVALMLVGAGSAGIGNTLVKVVAEVHTW